MLASLAAIAFFIWLSWRKARARRRVDSRSGRPPLVTSENKPLAQTRPAEPVRPPVAATPVVKTLFISYRRQDSADITGRINDRLIHHFGRDAVFKDVDSIPLGIDFRKHLQEAVSRCHVLVVVIGTSWVDSRAESGNRRLDDPRDHLRIEIEAALERHIPVIPVLVQGAIMPAEEVLPHSMQALAYRNAIPVRADPDFHVDVDRLIRGIESHFGQGAS
jgi:hypothetical protein